VSLDRGQRRRPARPPAAAAASSARPPHLGRLRGPAGFGDAGPYRRASPAAGRGRRSPDLRPAVVGRFRAGLAGALGGRRGSPQDGIRRRGVCGGRVHLLHDRSRRVGGRRDPYGAAGGDRGQASGPAVGTAGGLAGGPGGALPRTSGRPRGRGPGPRPGAAMAGCVQVRQSGRPYRHDVPPPCPAVGRPPFRARSVGRRDRPPDLGRRARVCCSRAAAAGRSLRQPRAPLRRRVRKRGGLHRGSRGFFRRVFTSRGGGAGVGSLQAQPPLGLGQVQHLPHSGPRDRRRRRAAGASEDGRYQLPGGVANGGKCEFRALS